MSNQIENSIIHRLPRELQIECLQLLIPSQRLLVVGHKKSGKTTFINQLREREQEYIDKKGVQIMELNKDKVQFNKNPTKIICICDSTSCVSISQIHDHYIPKYKHLQIPFVLIINKADISCSKWKISHIKTLQKKIHVFEKELGITIPIHWISNKTKFDFYKKTRIMILK
jgi:GTPase SAR1 family protein